MVSKLKKLTNSKTHFPVHSQLSTNLRTQKLTSLVNLSTEKKICYLRNPRLRNQKLEEVRRSYRLGGLEVKSQYLIINSEI